MSISWNEIRKRAIKFQDEWKDASDEKSDSQSFWNDFFNIFEISRRRVAVFENHVKKLNDKNGFIDLFWQGTLLIEQKSESKDLSKAYEQALGYFDGIEDAQLPKFVLVCDFQNFHLFNMDEGGKKIEFKLSELERNIHEFSFILGHSKNDFQDESPVNFKAVKIVSELRDGLYDSGYQSKDLETFLARLVFCMFADDTGIFQIKDHLTYYIETKTKKDGSDLSMHLSTLFQVLDTPTAERSKNLDEDLAKFPYVNGSLFKAKINMPHFDSKLREKFVKCCYFNWEKISPAIFGSLFQSVMDPTKRHDMGAHYTSESNILKAIDPLFLNDFYQRLDEGKTNKDALISLLKDIKKSKILDPACGCGNFLIVAYRELRLLEIEVHKSLSSILGERHSVLLEDGQYPGIDVDNLFGIESEESAAALAQVAIWLVDHQMNIQLSQEFGTLLKRIPLRKSPRIVIANALQIDWNEIIPKEELKYIVGNPPFVSKQKRKKDQTADQNHIFKGVKKSSNLDYVSCWFKKSLEYISGTKIESALVSTNSICQGEQVATLFKELYGLGLRVNFAHRTFKWSNEAARNAQVYVIIVGYALHDRDRKVIYEYEHANSVAVPVEVRNINPYLVDAADKYVEDRRAPISDVPPMSFGSKPNDGGNLLFDSKDEVDIFLKENPKAGKFVKKLHSGREFLNGAQKYCLWFKDASPKDIKESKGLYERVLRVKKHRLASTKEATRKLAENPTSFAEMRQPSKNYILVPATTSENREYMPFGYVRGDEIINNTCFSLETDDKYIFGVISSKMHMVWTKNVCGRLKGDYRYSNKLVYNNFPFPVEVKEEVKALIRVKTSELINERKKHGKLTLAEMYDPDLMPFSLRKAHLELDKVVDKCFQKKAFKSEAERMKLLFELYDSYTGGDIALDEAA